VFYFENTYGLVVALMHIYLFELCAVLSYQPFTDTYHTKLEVFNNIMAYVFLAIIQIFSQKHEEDFRTEDKVVD